MTEDKGVRDMLSFLIARDTDDGRLGQVDPRVYGTPAAPLPAEAAE
jgi:hypothetical protein